MEKRHFLLLPGMEHRFLQPAAQPNPSAACSYKCQWLLQWPDDGGKRGGLGGKERRLAMNRRCGWSWSTNGASTSLGAEGSSWQRRWHWRRRRSRSGSRTDVLRTSGSRRHTSTSSTGQLLTSHFWDSPGLGVHVLSYSRDSLFVISWDR